MTDKPDSGKRLFVLDTNVLMHDPTALFRFMEHDIHIPMMVLEELDRSKKGVSEVARNVRQTTRFMDELMAGASKAEIDAGLPLPPSRNVGDNNLRGRLFFQTHPIESTLPKVLPGNVPDNDILSVAIDLRQENPGTFVTLVSKDINLRIKAAILGIHAEDYYNDQVLDDVNLLFSGTWEIPPDFWDTHSKNMASWKEAGRTFYQVSGPAVASWHPNQCLFSHDDRNPDFQVRRLEDGIAILELLKDYRTSNHTVWGISARNREQNFALNLLLDPDLDFVTLLGAAGTGKTLLALAVGLSQTLDDKRYREIIMTRVTVPVGDDIGFLPGTEEEKMTPWMGALMDNLEVLSNLGETGNWGRAATQDLLTNRIKIHSLNFMRGRTFQNKYLIIDEAQNLTSKQMKTLVTRAGPGTKVVCLGNIAQIDTPYLSETTSGLTYVVDRFKTWANSGHVTLLRGERSRLAEFASESL
jgi:PhoH-like ATPase